jgi:hypothetical protein
MIDQLTRDMALFGMTPDGGCLECATKDKRIEALEARLDAVEKVVPKLQTMVRMPNTEWIADEHNAAIKTIKAALEQDDEQ